MANTSKFAKRAISILLGATLLFGGTLTAYAQLADDRVTSDGFVFDDVYGAAGDGYAFMGDDISDNEGLASFYNSTGNLISKSLGNVTPEDTGKDNLPFYNFFSINNVKSTLVYEADGKLGLFDLVNGKAATNAVYDRGSNAYDSTRKLTYTGFLTFGTKANTSSDIGTYNGAKLTIYDGVTLVYEENISTEIIAGAYVSAYNNSLYVSLSPANGTSISYVYTHTNGKYEKKAGDASEYKPSSTFYKGSDKYKITVDNGVLQLSTNDGTPASLGISVGSGSYMTDYYFDFISGISEPIIYLYLHDSKTKTYYNISGVEIPAFKNKSIAPFGDYIVLYSGNSTDSMNNIEIYNDSLTLQRKIDCIDAKMVGGYTPNYIAYLVKDEIENKFLFKILTNKLADMGNIESSVYADDIKNYSWSISMSTNDLIVLDESGNNSLDESLHSCKFLNKSESETVTKTPAELGITSTNFSAPDVYETYNSSHPYVAIIEAKDENKIYIVDESLQSAKSLSVTASESNPFGYLSFYPVPIKGGFFLYQNGNRSFYDYDLNKLDVQIYSDTNETGAFNVLTSDGTTTTDKDLQPISVGSYKLGLSKAKNAFATSGNAVIRYDSDDNKVLTYVNDGNGKHGAIDKNGKVVIPLEYDDYFDCGTPGERYILLKKGDKWNFFDLSTVLTDVKFDDPPTSHGNEDQYIAITVTAEDASANGIEAWIKNPTIGGEYELKAKLSTAEKPKEALKNMISNDGRALIQIYDLSLYVNGSKTEENFGELLVKFPIPQSYAKYQTYVYHCHKDDTANITKHEVTVDSTTLKAPLDGIKDLCSFAVAFKALEETVTPTPTYSTTPTSTNNGTTTTSGTTSTAGDLAKTGDHVGTSVLPFAMLALVSGAVIVLSLVRRKQASKQ